MEIIFVRHGESTQNEAYKNNTDYDLHNIILTKLGESQAIKSAIYLNMYGKFDVIYSSPLFRAKQTANLIKQELKFNNDIIINNLLEEYNDGILDTMQIKEKNEYIAKNKKLTKLFEKETKETNLFKKYKITEQIQNEYFRYIKSTLDYNDQIKNVGKFLNYLKKQNYKRVLVVCHGGILDCISSIITNTSLYNNDLKIVLSSQTTKSQNPVPFIQKGNCDIIGILLENKKYKLIIPRNNLHLK